METALQELIKELTIELQSKYDYLLLTITSREEHKTHGEIFALNAAIISAKAKLPKEREQILTAYSFGSLNKTENLLNGVDKITAQEYYETNFNK
jgi:hypothetical protein